MKRLSTEELTAAEMKILMDIDTKLTAFRKSVHEYVVLEAKNRDLNPHEMSWALVQEAALCAGVAAQLSLDKGLSVGLVVGEFIGILAQAIDSKQLRETAEKIMNATIKGA